MQLSLFLDHIQKNSSYLEKEAVIPFIYSTDVLPIVFNAHLISYLKEKNNTIELLDVEELELSHIFSRLQTSFLGMKLVYWLRGIENRDKKSRQQLINYLSEYQGPHHVIYMMSKDDSAYYSKKNGIELPSVLSTDMILSLLGTFKKVSPSTIKYITHAASKYNALSLDQVCMLIGYLQVVGKPEDFSNIMDRVVESEYSLFSLAQHFFAKNNTDFFKLWSSIGETYPITFWCVYWSEQLWRAYYVRYYMEKGQLTQAKSISARLPFSFLQKDWKKVTLIELRMAHQWIYELDRAYKNNLETEMGVDLFFNKFFLSEFQKK